MRNNDDIIKNTVSPLNQTTCIYKVINKPNPKMNVLFIGNSITLHEKKPSIGWNNDFGMAASCEENDYVHQVISGLERKYGPISYEIANSSDWEFNYWDKKHAQKYTPLKEFNADVIIFRLGENVNRQMLNKYNYEEFYEAFVKSLITNKTKVIITNTFWSYDLISKPMERVAKRNNFTFVNISDLGFKDENKAIGLFAHEGVACHPGDLGMKRIAERILAVL